MLKMFSLVLFANLDLTDGRFSLFMDERGLYDGVYKTLHSENIKDFLFSVFDGNSHLYGRVFWNVNSIICFVPEIIFGPKGLIFFSRMSSVFFLSTSCLVLSAMFFKNYFFRLSGFFVLINIPFVSYYMTMPKPEPLQLFFFSLFLFFLKKNNYSINKKFWFFLGLSVGAKISMLPIAIGVVFFCFYQACLLEGVNKTLLKTPTMVSSVLLGLSVAVPILLISCLVSILLYNLLNKYLSIAIDDFSRYKGLLIIGVFFVNVFYSLLIKETLGFASGLYRWFTQTVLNTSHGFDSSEIDFFSWIEYFFCEFLSPFLLINIFTFVFATVLVFLIIKIKRESKLSEKLVLLTQECLLLVVSGAALNALVFVTASRIWGFYLFPGTVLLSIGLISSCEMFLINKLNVNSIFVFKNNLGKKVSTALFVSIMGTAMFFWFPQNLNFLENLANRTKTEAYKKNYNSYLQIKNTLVSISKEKNRKIHIKNIGSPFIPDNNQFFSIISLERPYTQWGTKNEILLVKDIGNVVVEEINSNLFNYHLRLDEKTGYDKHVVNPDEKCQVSNCYKRVAVFENGTELLVLTKNPE